MKIFVIILFLSLFSVSNSYAQEDWFSYQAEDEFVEKDYYSHYIGLFTGAMSNLKNGNATFSVAAEYNYTFPDTNPLIGLGLFTEVSFTEDTEFIIGFPVSIQPWNEVKFWLAPAVWLSSADKKDIDELHETGTEKFLLRVGGSYMFHIDNYTISPRISADVVGSKVCLVYGIGFGLNF